MERALITGAAGFIGSHLAAELLRRGWSVTGLDARSPASDPVVGENLAELTVDPRFQFVAGGTASSTGGKPCGIRSADCMPITGMSLSSVSFSSRTSAGRFSSSRWH